MKKKTSHIYIKNNADKNVEGQYTNYARNLYRFLLQCFSIEDFIWRKLNIFETEMNEKWRLNYMHYSVFGTVVLYNRRFK